MTTRPPATAATQTRRHRLLSTAAYGLVLVTLSACGTTSETTGTTGDRTVTVLAAASLTESFERLSADFEDSHPGITVEVSHGSSATLVQQVNQGAPAHAIALAGEAAAEPLDDALVKGSATFATNVLEIAVPPSNPAQVTDINDLGRPGLKVVLCAETVPCGEAADATFRKARIVPSVVSREVDVKATLSKVRLGEADAAVVYHSDVVAAQGAVEGVAIRDPFNTSLSYPIVTLADDPATAAFVDYVLSTAGQQTLRTYGLGPP
ncbi:molybdate ABC transporter substrate-binding protein [Intrasporangium sp.]|uniref:molybdate ABC transporter substrate-binding protein n=1 Tax=Intrasporangium sp. TaxID=1925024 RepID=UPI002939EA1A|nr:molybdate ABC transporter substrate-binding protein [Intrasporangium sp.]MDV3223039.1 molybdate ABC transporter substrate-binding protein [Intrasporangium sp.]